ncbi:MAG: hypothetical protein IJX87_01500 [Clostridia bacterium]|nr:hypothetical protein [Clostridia bacterium]
MGKKKSMVLMVLLTIVIVVLCAITVFPTFALGGVKKWNPAIKQYDLGADLGGVYYAYYYPEGVISEAEYEDNKKMLEGDELADYEASYLPHGGLYLEREKIVTGDTATPDFEEAFNAAAAEIAARYAANGYSDYRVSVVDDYALKVELPVSDSNAGTAFTYFSYTGEMTLAKGGELVDELKGKEADIKDLIKGFSVGTQYDVAYIKVNLTKAGRKMVDELKSSLTESTAASESESATTLDVKIGDQVIVSIYKDHIDTDNEVKVPLAYKENKALVNMIEVLLDSALEKGGFDIEFAAVTNGEIRVAEPVAGENASTVIYVTVGVVMLLLIVLAVLKMGGFGWVNAYTTLSYLIIVGLCFAFISKGIFEITLGSVLIFVAGLVLTNVVHAFIYNAIKEEAATGKTMESSVKGGYKTTLWGIVDLYAVLLLGSLALLIGAAGVQTFALQAIIVVVTAAFCNLLWGRVINYVAMSASKDKFKFFRLVRKEDEDDD